MQVEVPTITVGSEEADVITGYQIVSVDITPANATVTADTGVATAFVDLTISAPEGTSVVGGGYKIHQGDDWNGNDDPVYILDINGYSGSGNDNASSILTNCPASDGSAWLFSATFGAGSPWARPSNDPDNLFVWGTVYAICMAV